MAYYGGFNFANQKMFNPWSVVNDPVKDKDEKKGR
jgi:hypothetical protein